MDTFEVRTVDWYTTVIGPVIGIVHGVDKITGEEKSYIGTGEGFSEADDIETIVSYGATFRR